MLSSLRYVLAFTRGAALAVQEEDQLQANSSPLPNIALKYFSDDADVFPPSRYFLGRSEPAFAGDPRYPLTVKKERACLAAMVPGFPAVVYVKRSPKRRGNNKSLPYYSLWEAQYLQELLMSTSANTTLCEVTNNLSDTLPGGGILGEILRKGKGDRGKEHEAQHIPIGLIVNSNDLSLSSLADFMRGPLGNNEQPTLLIHLGDEWGKTPPGEYYNRIVGEDGLVLRQYYHRHYKLESRPVVLTVPLGYSAVSPFSANSCEASRSALLLTRRDNDWAFIGMMYKHREEMIHQLSHWFRFRNYYFWPPRGLVYAPVRATKMLEVYRNSVFVPVGRGQVSLDCFRIYEAIISGAIPVVVGPEEEVSSTFAEHRDIPMVVASNWSAAASRMSKLLGSPDELRALQRKLPKWICETIGRLRFLIAYQFKRTAR